MNNTMSYGQMRRHLSENKGGIIHGGAIIAAVHELPRPEEYAGQDPARRAEVIGDARRQMREAEEMLRNLGEAPPEISPALLQSLQSEPPPIEDEEAYAAPRAEDPARAAKQQELEILLLKGQGATSDDRARIELLTEELGLARLLRMAGYSAPPVLSMPPKPDVTAQAAAGSAAPPPAPPVTGAVQKIGARSQPAKENAGPSGAGVAPVTRLKPNAE